MPKITVPVRGLWHGPRTGRGANANNGFSNMFIRVPGMAETRRGFPYFGSGTWTPTEDASALYVWKDGSTVAYLIHRSTTLGYTTDGTSYSNYSGTYTGADVRTRFAEAKENLYFTSTAGVYRLDAYNGTPVVVGLQKPLSISTASSAATGAGFSAPGAVAYRATLVFQDANNNVYESAPSPRGIYRWTGTTNAVDVTVRIPAGLSASYKIRLYRTAQVTASEDEPSDEMGLVYERYLTSTDYSTNKYVTVSDIVPDSMRGATGYFCPSQQGILQSNERPPLANDLAWHKDTLFYSGTTSKHRLTLRLISVSGSNGLAANDTVTIAGTTYTAKASGATGDQFNLVTSFTGAQANVQGTTINLVNAINASANNSTVYAYYMSGPDDPAGIFMIEERGLGASSFAATTSSGAETCWAPELPTNGTTVSSTNDAAANRVYFSKPKEPEAVPILNYLDVGSRADPIARIVPLRDSLFVFKRSEGAFRIVGNSGQFSVVEHDRTARIIGRDTAARLNNEIYMFSEKGFVATSDAGTRTVSDDVAHLITSRLYTYDGSSGTLRAAIHDQAHAVGHEELGLYIAWIPGSASAPYSWRSWTYCPTTNAWTNDGTPLACASAQGEFAGSRTVIAVDDDRRLSQESSSFVDGSSSAISPGISFANIGADTPHLLKNWTRVEVLLETSAPGGGTPPTSIDLSFTTDLNNVAVNVTVATDYGGAHNTLAVPVPVPTSMQLGTTLSVAVGCSTSNKWFAVSGLVAYYEEGGENAGR